MSSPSTIRVTYTFDMGVRGHTHHYQDYHNVSAEQIGEILSHMDQKFVSFGEEDGTVVLYPVSRILKVEVKEL